jgi:segregation and condensation protein A
LDTKREIMETIGDNSEKIGQNQIYDVITSRKPDWQEILYDLINTDQLDPWDIDIVLLTHKYFQKILELEEHDFYISSKVLLAAALLLRIKSEFLLNRHIRSIDEILFGKKEDKKQAIERMEIDENELPILMLKTPLPRLKKITLLELTEALERAINTESRRIKKEVILKKAKRMSEVDFPTFKKIDLKDRIKEFYARTLSLIKKEQGKQNACKVGYSHLVGKEREERVACFLPMLHLSNTKKLWLEQETHLDEIWVYLYEYFEKNRDEFLKELEKDSSFSEEISEFVGEIEEIEESIEKEEKIDEVTGFSSEEE